METPFQGVRRRATERDWLPAKPFVTNQKQTSRVRIKESEIFKWCLNEVIALKSLLPTTL